MIDLYIKYDEYTDGKYKELVKHWIDNEKFIAKIRVDMNKQLIG